jgi:hypothetical protein
MTREEKQKLDAAFQEMTKSEIAFLNSEGIEPNEHGAYPFKSFDESCNISLDMLLLCYKQWLIENGIVKEL